MKILNLHIQKFRGIIDLNLNLNGKNAVIFGPNGVGKSAVVDAVDFLLRGEVSRLTGEGTGDVSTTRHGPHIGSQPEEAKVSATIQSISGTTFNVERTVAQKDRVTIDPAFSTLFNDMVTYAQSGAHCLARRELLRYILTTPATRSQQIQMLLDITDIKTIRDAFTKLKKTAASNLKDTTDSLKRHSSELLTKVGADSSDQLLEKINSLRDTLGGNALTSLVESSFTNGLLYSDTKENTEIASCIRGLEELEKYISTLQPVLQEKLQSLRDAVRKIENENTSIEDIGYISLIKSGLALLDGTGRCPLCLHEWASEAELRQILQDRKDKSESLSAILDTYQKSITSLLNEVSTYKAKIGILPQQLKKWDNGCVAELENKLKSISDISFQDNTAYKNFNKVQDLVVAVIKQSPDAFLDLIQQQLAVLRPLIDQNSKAKSDAWQALNAANELYNKIGELNKKLPNIKLAAEKAAFLLETYDASQATVLNDLFASISDRFTEFYREMHNDDEKQFSAVLNNDGASVNMSVDFYGHGQFPPMAFHSEGHQDSMGIALFFALMEKLTTSESGLVVLDDVVMSVDIEHRKNFCRLIKKFFPERQFIITTHDTVWAKNLVNEGVVERKNSIQFLYWNVTEGPIMVVGQDVWSTSRLKADVDIHGASAFFRREMECFFENVCDKLHARIRYNNVHKWDYGQYMNAAYKELQDLIKKAEQQAHVFQNTEGLKKLSSLSNALKAQITAVTADNWVTNSLIHFNPDYEISKSEFLAAVDALEQLSHSFECPKCSAILSVTYNGETPVALMCKCGNYAYPLKQ
ncbi:MAG: AAA family ATPase [Bacillota bacterium]|nr:AAA family ATPase [Bacillota bacterium]